MRKRPTTAKGLLCALAGLLAAVAPVPASAGEDLSEMSLEELLGVELRGMRLTRLHHTHEAGEWMVGISSMYMRMDGILDGSDRVSRGEVLQQYPVTPTDMDMAMVMGHVMGAPTDWLTLMLMVPYVYKEMDHVTRMGTEFTTRSEGLGDIELSGLLSVYRSTHHRLIAQGGLRFPSGSIDQKDDTPAGFGRLPYPMQLGSGTWDLRLGGTYLGQAPGWGWGAHLGGIVRTGENHRDYTLGNEGDFTIWLARRLFEGVSVSSRLETLWWEDIQGADPALNPQMVPTADPDLRAGRRVDLLFGVNLFRPRGWLAGNRLAFEGGFPVHQDLDGPQLRTEYHLRLAWDWTF